MDSALQEISMPTAHGDSNRPDLVHDERRPDQHANNLLPECLGNMTAALRHQRSGPIRVLDGIILECVSECACEPADAGMMPDSWL